MKAGKREKPRDIVCEERRLLLLQSDVEGDDCESREEVDARGKFKERLRLIASSLSLYNLLVQRHQKS